MNVMGSRVREMWRRHFPKQYAQIDDPVAYFTSLGEELWRQVEELAAAIAGADQPGEGYLGKVGRLNMARLTAEGEVLRQAVPPGADEEEEEVEDP